MARHTRYQGMIIEGDKILLICHTRRSDGLSYWVIPGGGIEPEETAEDCVIREMKEETNLTVRIERLLFEEPVLPGNVYHWRKSYLCTPLSGEASPGYEPEPEAAAAYSISDVRWFDLRDESGWGDEVIQDPYTYPQLKKLREVLGYTK